MEGVGGDEGSDAASAVGVGGGAGRGGAGREAWGLATVGAFGAGNLPAGATAWARADPDAPRIITGDDDKAQEIRTGRNPGREKAREAAIAGGGVAVFPIFGPGEQAAHPGMFSDFNDLGTRSSLGSEAVCRQLAPVPHEAVERWQQAYAASMGHQHSPLQESYAVRPSIKA